MANESSAPVEFYENPEHNDLCFYEPPPLTNVRFVLVTVIGSVISFVSIAENLLLFILFATKKAHRNNHNMYLMLLAFFDFFISAAYICLMSVNVLTDYLRSPRLVSVWFSYMVPMITISHIAMTSASFLIITATFERYCLTTNSRLLPWSQKHRKLLAGGAIGIGIISKGTICLEFDISWIEECAGTMAEWQMKYREFVFDTPYHTVWRFWYRNFVTIFAPFAILAYLNARIVHTLSYTNSGGVFVQLAGNIAVEQAKRKATARAATRTMVAVTCCYLISNIVNVLLTVFEHIDKDTLFQEYVNFYAIAVDMVSLLTTLACACRLPIYCYCQKQMRQEIRTLLVTGWKRLMRQRRTLIVEDSDRLMNSYHSSGYHTLSASLNHRSSTAPATPPPLPVLTEPIPPAVPECYAVIATTAPPPEMEAYLDECHGFSGSEESLDDIELILATGTETLL